MTVQPECKLCDQDTDNNYIGGLWVCGKCYPKFKEVFEAYIPFVDTKKLHDLIITKRRELDIIKLEEV